VSGLESKIVGIRVDPANKVLFALELNPGFDILAWTFANAKVSIISSLNF
jgi:hypothetical protein